MHIEFLSPQGPLPTEKYGIDEFRAKLPGSWKGYSNFYIRNERRRGQDREVDVILITPDRLIVVDLKHGRGKFESRSGTWFQNDENVGRSAANKIRDNAKVLGDLIRKHVPRINGAPPVESAVVFTHPSVDFTGLDPQEKDRCFSLSDFVRIGNEQIFKRYFTSASEFGGSNALNGGAAMSALRGFFTNDRRIEPRKAKYHGFVPVGPAEFEHTLYREFAAVDEADRNYTGVLRLWDFAKDPEAFALEEDRKPIAERERNALGHISASNPFFYDNSVLRSQAHDREFGLNFSEVFEKHPDLVRLTRYSGSIRELAADRRVELAKIFLEEVADLHRIKLAHRDLDRHSVWIDERRSKIVLSGFGASHFPEVETIGNKKGKLLAGGNRTPEDQGEGVVGSPFQQDVFLAAATAFTILTGQRLATLDDIPVWDAKVFDSGEHSELRHFREWFARSLDWDTARRFSTGMEAATAFVDAISRSATFNIEKQLLLYHRDVDLMEYALAAVDWFKRKPYRVFRTDQQLIKTWPSQYIGDRKAAALSLLAFFSRSSKLEGIAAKWAPRIRLSCLCMDGLLLVQDWVPGTKLADFDGAGRDVAAISSLLLSLVDAVNELHSAGMAHGDLKPANLIVSKDEDAKEHIVLIDLLDYVRPADGERTSSAYCPPIANDDRMVRDRFAVGVVVIEIINRWISVGGDGTALKHRVENAVLRSSEDGEYWASLKLLRGALAGHKHVGDMPSFNLTVEIRNPPFVGIMLAEDGCYNMIRRQDKDQIEIFGFDQKVTIDFDPADRKPKKAALFPVDARASNWANDRHQLRFKGELKLSHSPVDRFGGFEELFKLVEFGGESVGGAPIASAASASSDPLSRPILSLNNNIPAPAAKAPRFPVAKFWQETIAVEEEILPEIKLVDAPKETHEPGTIVLSCVEPPVLDAVDSKAGKPPAVLWNGDTIGVLDSVRTGQANILVRNARGYKRLKAGDILKIQSTDDLSSFRRRSSAVDRILRAQGQIPNLISYFDPMAKIEPVAMADEIPDGALNAYKLNDDQEEAFRHLWSNGPVGLLQGPPGTGKTYFTSAFVHWALNKGGMRNVLVLSQSNEAVNTVAERVLETFEEHGGDVELLRVGQFEKISPPLRHFHSQSVQDRYRELFRADIKDRLAAVSQKLGLDREYVREAYEIEAGIGSIVKQMHFAERDVGTPDLDPEVVEAAEIRLGRLATVFTRLVDDDFGHVDGASDDILDMVRDKTARRHHVFDPDARQRLLRLLELSRSWISVLGSRTRNLEEFLARSRNLVCGTCVGIGRPGLGIERGVFDLVIIDEAARCTPGELAVGMQSGRRVLLVGDHRQLPPLFEHEALEALTARLPDFDRADLKRSDFERAFTSTYGASIARTLRTQYRMASEISGLVSSTFYPGQELKDSREEPSDLYKLLPPPYDHQVTWLDTGLAQSNTGENEAGTSFTNRREATDVLSLLKQVAGNRPFLERAPSELKLKEGEALIGVICTYAQQAELIGNMLDASDLPADFRRMVKVDTVDGYQGKENRIIIFSLVRNNAEKMMGHVKSRNRINVAISRAKDRLIIIGSASMFEKRNNSLRPILRKLKGMDRVRSLSVGEISLGK
ncbi:AAA domain-containing protein [Rhizobium leguminosarum]|uniref:AAA domain-containing protein n=1 Tax=Rhizobium leguminosarum TaxID=384 RepID=UPI0014415887|nr:AAA domain-containing protein [Rhizobium leguminosarum]MBB4343089.1 serine/threonine protein kinase [Rhizobium leguminosarum]MBB6296167.1 serine/threonine protein kinase [Rhizobium leguminosarum]